MTTQSVNKLKLGIFVLTAVLFLILGLYYIGSKRNFFSSTINVSAKFDDIGGLMPGNNVRFNGINVGTVSEVYAISDSVIKVDFTIDESEIKFITKSSVASIGTDGLLGNKLINISPGRTGGKPIREGDELATLKPLQMTNALRTLMISNDNIKVITENLKNVSEKFSNETSLWKLLSDPTIAENVRNAIVHFKLTGTNSAIITGNLSQIVKDVQSGKGSIGALLTDPSFSNKLNQTIVKIEAISDSVAILSGNFNTISQKMKSENGIITRLLTDTTFIYNLNLSMENIKNGSQGFNENMEALKHTVFLRNYFKKQEKSKSKKNN